MSAFLLVHGAWCWEKVVPLLEGAGHGVVAPDLPAHGNDRAPVAEVTLGGYAERVCEVLDGSSEPVVLVGHSLGGAVIGEVAERHPEKVGLLVYLSGSLLPNGMSVFDSSQADEEAADASAADVDAEKGTITIRTDRAKDLFYGDCSDEDVEWAKARLTPEPLAPLATPVSVGEAFERVRRVYIECLRDRAVGPATQKRMYTKLPCEEVISMETGHSPFLSRPEELAGHLDSLARL